MRTVECPKCGTDISDTYESADPSVGIMAGGWYCDACDGPVGDEDDYEPHDDDVMVFGTSSGSSHICACGTPYEMGYGLAGGGGVGPYMYCPKCGAVTQKSKELD